MSLFISFSATNTKLTAYSAVRVKERLAQFSKSRSGIYFSPDSIPDSKPWFNENEKALKNATLGLVLVSRRSIQAPWLLYETSALLHSPGVKKCVILLLDVRPNNMPIGNPFANLECQMLSETGCLKKVFSRLGIKWKVGAVADKEVQKLEEQLSLLCVAEERLTLVETMNVVRKNGKNDEHLVLKKKKLVKEAYWAMKDAELNSDQISEWFKLSMVPESIYTAFAEQWYRRRANE